MYRLLLAGLALVLATGTTTSADAQTRKNVILYIGDGYGISPKTATRMALGQGQDGSRFSDDPNFQLLASDRLPYNTTVTTHSLNSWVTDSAPGATVYSAGQAGKIDNEFIALDPSTLAPIETILEAAKKEGYAVGIVSTARITHATPASFASHIWNRNLEDYIAAQYVSTSQAEYEAVFAASPLDAVSYDAERDWRLPAPKVGVKLDVILGGGGRHWLPARDCPNADTPNADIRDRGGIPVASPEGGTLRLSGRRPDCVDLVQVARDRGYAYVTSRDGLLGLDLDQFAADNEAALLGLFNASHMLYEQERQLEGTNDEPSMTDLTEIAIEVLERKSDKGFFLVVESGRIDHLEHANAGGIQVDGSQLVIDANFEAFFADGVYGGITPDVPGPVYGSDYMIKEVLAFDYAIEAGRQYLGDGANGQTLIMQTADHECGGFAAVSLNDPTSDGTSRTYARQPTQDGGRASRATPTGIERGAAWFPQYSMTSYQGLMYPQAMESGPRIVISYGSNPVVNGNTPNVGSTPGNHTPSDIFVGAEDNVGGTYARRIAGRGLLDNTDLTPIMDDFLGVVSGRTVSDGGTLPVFFSDFDADGVGDPRGEYVVITNGSDTGEDADLSGTTFAVVDPLTETVTFVASPSGVLAPGESAVFSNLEGTLPANTLPDGPGALVHVEGGAAVGDGVASLDGRVIAAVVYRDEGNIFGTVRGDEPADPEAFAEALAALRQATSAGGGGPVDLSLVTAPNPTTGRSRIAFGLAEADEVRVVVYDALGREVAVLADGPHTAGRHHLTFDGSSYPSGSYVVRVEGARPQTARLTVAR